MGSRIGKKTGTVQGELEVGVEQEAEEFKEWRGRMAFSQDFRPEDGLSAVCLLTKSLWHYLDSITNYK
jgi:hypothetical protein